MILKKCVFIYLVIVNYVNMWNGGKIIKALGCEWKNEGSNLILNLSWSWHYHDDMSWVCWIKIQNFKLFKLFYC
jgi:hypothetical protein